MRAPTAGCPLLSTSKLVWEYECDHSMSAANGSPLNPDTA